MKLLYDERKKMYLQGYCFFKALFIYNDAFLLRRLIILQVLLYVFISQMILEVTMHIPTINKDSIISLKNIENIFQSFRLPIKTSGLVRSLFKSRNPAQSAQTLPDV